MTLPVCMTSTFHLMEDVQLLDERETDNLIEMQRGRPELACFGLLLCTGEKRKGTKKSDEK